jgi:uncharacterized Zn finger protein (UPF0148 family)
MVRITCRRCGGIYHSDGDGNLDCPTCNTDQWDHDDTSPNGGIAA